MPNTWIPPKLATGCFIALQRDKIQLHPAEHRHKLPQQGKLDKPLVQLYPQGADPTIKKNHELSAAEQAPQTQQSKQNEQADKYSEGKVT